MDMIMPDYVAEGLRLLATLFLLSVALLVLVCIVLFIIDISQTHDAIRRNYPLIGRFRGLFISLGEFFRQYFFAMDREEMPFNRAEREWVKRAVKKTKGNIAFGSTRMLTLPGTAIFVNCPFPTLESDHADAPKLVIGPNCPQPYEARSFFNISAMSYGALSQPAVEALSHGAAKAGCWLNTGEGGLAPQHLISGCDIVFQIGTAKYGVRDATGAIDDGKLAKIAARDPVKMFEIKLSQGAKPGKGGILPATKVTEEIAAIRGIPAGQASISPNRFPEINSEEDLINFINHVRDVTGKPTGIKFVVGGYGWIGRLCELINKRGAASAPDFITVDSGDGGTGAAPMPLMDNVGLPIKESLPMVANILAEHGLQDRIRLIASGKLITPSEAAWALCAGADFVSSARGFMFSLGCIQALKCNKNTCPTGITTHNKRLQRGLDPANKATRVANYHRHMVKEVGIIAHSCGVPHLRRLKRMHVRIVQPDGRSQAMDDIWG